MSILVINFLDTSEGKGILLHCNINNHAQPSRRRNKALKTFLGRSQMLHLQKHTIIEYIVLCVIIVHQVQHPPIQSLLTHVHISNSDVAQAHH